MISSDDRMDMEQSIKATQKLSSETEIVKPPNLKLYSRSFADLYSDPATEREFDRCCRFCLSHSGIKQKDALIENRGDI